MSSVGLGFFGTRIIVAFYQRIGILQVWYSSQKSGWSTGGSSAAQVLSTLAEMPFGPWVLPILSYVLQSCCSTSLSVKGARSLGSRQGSVFSSLRQVLSLFPSPVDVGQGCGLHF